MMYNLQGSAPVAAAESPLAPFSFDLTSPFSDTALSLDTDAEIVVGAGVEAGSRRQMRLPTGMSW